MPYIDSTYLNDSLSSAKVTALAPTAGELTQLIEMATAETETALVNGGYLDALAANYTVGNCPNAIQLACFGAFAELAYGRNDLELPEGFRAYVQKLELIRNGKMEIPNVSRSTVRAVGGVSFTESREDVSVADGSRPTIFSRKAFSEGGF